MNNKVSHQPWAVGASGHMEHEFFGKVWIKENEGHADRKPKKLKGKYCKKLYTWLEVDMHGRCWMCCPSWLPYPIGNVLEDSVEEIWNGRRAQELRRQIYTGEWNYCQHWSCPVIQEDALPTIKETLKNKTGSQFELDALKAQRLTIKELPRQINFSNDESCNLQCPSCRVNKLLFTSGPEYERRKKVNDKIIEMFLTEPTDREFEIFVTGSGDPFASKIYRDMLYNLDGVDFPNLSVSMQTNGVMYTPKMWDKLHKIHRNLRHCRISFDAGCKDTYENKTRLNGDWDLLLENCKHLDLQRLSFEKFQIYYDFVVQVDNYKEMKQFIELCRENFPRRKKIAFSMVVDWGTWAPEVYAQKCIWKDDHPEHQQFLEILRDPIFGESDIQLGNISSLRHKALRTA